MKSTNEIYEIL